LGQKVHPISFRLGFIKTWDSRWYAEKDYSQLLIEDIRIRDHLKKKLYHAGVSKIEIERAASKAKKAKVTIYTARPGIIIGKKGVEVENLKRELQLERRVGFRRAMKKAVGSSLKLGAKGIKISCAGRLGGAEMARKEWYREGRVPLHTLRADIDFGLAEARTTYGIIGVKVWIFKGEVFPTKEGEERAA
jgi:small subunit ribosomal protein S3